MSSITGKMKALLILLLAATLSGCVHAPRHHIPRVKYYELCVPWPSFHREVIPYRSKDYIGYIDHRGTLHVWPVR